MLIFNKMDLRIEYRVYSRDWHRQGSGKRNLENFKKKPETRSEKISRLRTQAGTLIFGRSRKFLDFLSIIFLFFGVLSLFILQTYKLYKVSFLQSFR